MGLPFVRLIGKITPGMAVDGYHWGDSTYQFYRAFREQGFPIRVVSNGPGYPAFGRWAEHSEDLMRPIPDTFLNVMCLPVSEIGIALTINVKNIAITCFPEAGMRKDDIAIVDACDLVIVPPEDVPRFGRVEIDARFMSPFQVGRELAGFSP